MVLDLPPQFPPHTYTPGAIGRPSHYLYRPLLPKTVLRSGARCKHYTCSIRQISLRNTQGVKEAAVKADIARSKALLRAYHRMGSGSGIYSAYIAVILKSEFELGQPSKQRTRKGILTLHHLLNRSQDMALLITPTHIEQGVRASWKSTC